MPLDEAELEYFNRGKTENPRFWDRLGGEPSFEDIKILDLGCGHGSLCVYMASKGAKHVIGIDINKELINFARENVSKNFPHLEDGITFLCCEVSELPENEFDIIVSKDTFEHIIDLDKVLDEMKTRLKKGGRIYVGFGPLYNSPHGDHGRAKAVIPWGHIIFPESILIKRLNKKSQKKITSIQDLGLNKLSLAEYLRIFNQSDLSIIFLRVNASSKTSSKLFSQIRRIPFLEEYFSHNIYCVLER